MKQFTFEGKTKTVLGAIMALGVLCLILTAVGDDDYYTRTWSNYLNNTVFFVGIAFISLFIMAAFTTAYAGWHTVVKRVWESFALFLIPGLILLVILIVGVLFDWHHLYHWADEASVANDVILKGKSSFLNNTWYGLGTIIVVGIWIFFAVRLRNLSLEMDADGDENYDQYKKIKFVSAVFLPIAGFTSVAMIWQWVMSVDAHWYSTMFGWYATASWFVAAMALTIMLLIWLKSKGYYEKVSVEHFHDLGKYLFAFSIFWTYVWFSQYMLIWYSNNGEETIYFFTRMHEYPILYWGNIVLNFVLPFLVLLRNDTKRKMGTLFAVSLIVFIGHWFDFFQMIKPGVLHTAHELHEMHTGNHDDLSDAAHLSDAGDHHAEAAHTAHAKDGHATEEHHAEEGHGEHGSSFKMGFHFPGLLELGTMLGFLAGFLFFALGRLEKANLVPENHPFINESEHHHV